MPISNFQTSIFYVKNYPHLSQFFFMKEYQFRGMFLLLTFFENFNFLSTLFTEIMLIFRSLDLERKLIWQKNFVCEKVLFITQLSSHLLRKLLKNFWPCLANFLALTRGRFPKIYYIVLNAIFEHICEFSQNH